MLMVVYVRWVGGQSNVYINIPKFQFSSIHIERDMKKVSLYKNLLTFDTFTLFLPTFLLLNQLFL